MTRKRSFKIEVSPDAHNAAKNHSALHGISVKEYVSDLILKNAECVTEEMLAEANESKIDEENAFQEISENICELMAQVPSSPKTPSEISISLNIDSAKVSKILNDLYSRGEVERTKKGDEYEYWIKIKAGSSIYRIYDVITIDPSRAQTLEEIAKILPKISKAVIQNALYWLLQENLVNRSLRGCSEDRRKDSWEYWRLTNNALSKKGVEISDVLKILPEDETRAISVSDLALKLRAPKSTMRDTLKRLESLGVVGSVKATGNKTATAYYQIPQDEQMQKK